MSPLLASATGIGLMVIADRVLESLAQKMAEAGIGDAARQIAGLRKSKRQRKRFAALMDAAWQDLRRTDLDAADALRAALVERPDAAETLALEALKVLLFAARPDLTRLRECYTWSRGLLARQDKHLPAWEKVAAPLARYFDLLRKQLLDDPAYRPAAMEKETLDRLDGVYALLRAAQTPAGRLAIETHPPILTDAQLAAARQDYLAMLRQEHQYLDLAGLAPKVQNKVVKIWLEDIFIPLKARPEVARRKLLPPKVLRLFSEDIFDPQRLADTLDIPALLRLGQAVVLGDPGSGKSTLLKYLAYAIAAGKADLIGPAAMEQLPILIKIIDFVRASDDATSLKAHLCRTDDPIRCALFEAAIERGQALILLDALDEVPDSYSRGKVAEAVRRFVADHPGNTVLLTSRLVGYDGGKLAGHCQHVTLEKLPKQAVAGFVGNWYAAIEREAEGSEETIRAAYARAEDLQRAIESNPGVQGLAENPLLLTIIALVNWRGRKLPDRRVELYQHAAETLIDSWPFTQRGVRLDSRVVIGILEPVAYRLFAQRGSKELDETALRPLLVQAIAEKRGCLPTEAEALADELLPQITEQSGIFVERGIDPAGRRYYGFLHQTFAEYFAAHHLAARWRAGGLNLLPYARNPRWREVLRLMAGHLGLSDEQAATQLVANLLALPDDYPQLRRNLMLVADCLSDDTPVQAQASRYVMQQLAALFCQGPEVLRETAQTLLVRLGGTAHALALAESLLSHSQDADPVVRSRAAYALGVLVNDASRALGRLLQLGQDSHPAVRQRAADALGNLGADDPRALDRLIELSRDSSHLVRRQAAEALGNLRSAAPRIVECLLELSQDSKAEVQSQATSTLEHLGIGAPQVIDRLLELCQDDKPEVQSRAISALVRLARENQPVVARLLRLGHEDAAARRRLAVSVLKRLSSSDPQIVDHLMTLSQDAAPEVRQLTTDALGNLRTNEPRILDRLLQLSHDDAPGVRRRAAEALGCQEQSTPRILDRLFELSQDGDSGVRQWATFGLGRLGSGDPRAVDCLFGLSRDDDSAVRHRAAEALGYLEGNGPRLVDRLFELSQDDDHYVRFQAAYALGRLGGGDPRCLDRLFDLSRDNAPPVQFQAAEALAHLARRVPQVLDRLLELSQDGDPVVRRLTAYALSRLRQDDPRILDRLLELSLDAHPDVRCLTAYALGRLRSDDPRVVDRLLDLIWDNHADVQRRAVAALGNLDSDDPRILDRLLELSRETNGDLRIAVSLVAKSQGDVRALPALLDWLEDAELSPAAENASRVNEEAYRAVVAILTRTAPEPPLGFESPPQPVPGPWDEPRRALEAPG